MSSDSSEEEDLSAFREAAVSFPFPDSVLDSGRFEDGNTKKPSLKPSLRPRDDDDEPNRMRVTPEFQAFIAKRLSKFLDSELKEVEGTPHEKRKKRKKASEDAQGAESGVRLLGVSSFLLATEEEEPKVPKMRRKQSVRARPDDADDITEEEKCREAAVSADWVLSKRAVAGWEPSTKGEVVAFKASDVVIVQGSKKGDRVGKSGEETNGPNNEPRQLTEEEKKEKKKLKRFRRKQRLMQQKAKALKEDGESSAHKVTKKKKKKLISPEEAPVNADENHEKKNGLLSSNISKEERRHKNKVKNICKKEQFKFQEMDAVMEAQGVNEESHDDESRKNKKKKKRFLQTSD